MSTTESAFTTLGPSSSPLDIEPTDLFLQNRPSLPTRPLLLQGDCVQRLAELATNSVDLVVTDPPYVCRFKDRQGRTVANDNKTHWIEPAFREIHRLMKPNTVAVSFYGWGAVHHFMEAWLAVGLRPLGHIVWHKGYASRAGFLQARHEQAYLLAKGWPRKPDHPLPDVLPWTYSGNRHHPTEKAVSVTRPLIETFSKPGDVVLDPFMGSGTTGVAALQSKRRFIGCELDRLHLQTAATRLQNLT